MEIRLGKREYQFDERTLRLSAMISPVTVVPHEYDFDKRRASFPLAPWGNQVWGNCVKVSQANGLIRLERLEIRRTLPITEEVVVENYKDESEREFGARPVSAGDENDGGLYVLQNLRNWRKFGFTLNNHSYNIAAFGEIEPQDHIQVKSAIYLLHGVHWGLSLPLAARQMLHTGVWDAPAGQTGSEWQAGSWGGHAVFTKAYTEHGYECLTWGRKVLMTHAFIERYADECWAVVDSFDSWRNRPEIDVSAIITHLTEIGATNIER